MNHSVSCKISTGVKILCFESLLLRDICDPSGAGRLLRSKMSDNHSWGVCRAFGDES